MNEITIDFTGAESKRHIHEALERDLQLHVYFGDILGALRMRLIQLTDMPIFIHIKGYYELNEPAMEEAIRIIRVLSDTSKQIDTLKYDLMVNKAFEEKRLVDFTEAKNYLDIHQALQRDLEFPNFYGQNLDALWDCLTGFINANMHIKFKGFYQLKGSAKKEAERILPVFEDAIKKLHRYGFRYTIES